MFRYFNGCVNHYLSLLGGGMVLFSQLCVRKIIYFLSLLLIVFLAGCGDSANKVVQAEAKAKATFTENGIYIKYQADDRLNLVNQQSHSLVLVTYQLTDAKGFNTFAGYKEGLVKLLAGESFDKTVTAVSKQYIEPGSGGVITLDRAADTEHVGIVAGYYDLSPKKSSALLSITYDTSRHGFLYLKKSTTVNLMDITVMLGKDAMRVEEDDES